MANGGRLPGVAAVGAAALAGTEGAGLPTVPGMTTATQLSASQATVAATPTPVATATAAPVATATPVVTPVATATPTVAPQG
jgi:hypothetical protein